MNADKQYLRSSAFICVSSFLSHCDLRPCFPVVLDLVGLRRADRDAVPLVAVTLDAGALLLSVSHNFADLSQPPVASVRPLGANASEVTIFSRPRMTPLTLLFFKSQRMTNLSHDPEAIYRPSGEKATEVIAPLCPRKSP